MSKRSEAKLRSLIQDEIQAILEQYPDGNYDRAELLSDVRNDLYNMRKRLGLSLKTPIDVDLEDGILVVRFGSFIDKN